MSGNAQLVGEWGVYDDCFDDAAEAAYQRQQLLLAEGWTELTITCEPDTAETWTYRLRGVAPVWENVRNGATPDGATVHAVFARDGAAVAAKIWELSVGHADNGRLTIYPELPGWTFYEMGKGVSAYYMSAHHPESDHWMIPSVSWDSTPTDFQSVRFGSFPRLPRERCYYCGGEVAYGYCQVCGAQ